MKIGSIVTRARHSWNSRSRATSAALERAKREYELDGNEDANAAIAVYSELLQARLQVQAIENILASDAACSGLAVMFARTKTIHVKIYGTIPTRTQLEPLRLRLQENHDIHLPLQWDVRSQDTKKTIAGLDRDLYPDEQAAFKN